MGFCFSRNRGNWKNVNKKISVKKSGCCSQQLIPGSTIKKSRHQLTKKDLLFLKSLGLEIRTK